MTMSEPASVRLSTNDLPGRDCAEILRESYGRTVLRAEIEPLGEEPPYLDLSLWAVPGLGVATGACSPFSVHRTPHLIDNDDLILLVALSGGTVMKHRGREEFIADGQALLMSNAEPGFNRMQSSLRCVNLSMPRNLLAPLIGDLSAVLMQPMAAGTEALRLLVNYVGAMQGMGVMEQPAVRRLAVTHVHDLAALAIGATRDAAEMARGRGVRAARLRAIKADVVASIGHGGLTAAQIGARYRLSERYVRKLFESEGTSLSDFALGQRLLRTQRMLTDPRYSRHTITEIAFESGFNDLSYFNRVFRRRYGFTPSEIRAGASKGA